jgi:nucleoside-diphosphate-sugar epimerase
VKPPVLITGANGFVGSRLCGTLAEKGWPLQMAMRQTARQPQPKPNAQVFVHHDLAQPLDWSPVLREGGVVVHTAGLAHAHFAPEDYQRVNVDATLSLACQAADAGIKRFIFLSSIKVNGDSSIPDHPFTPEDNPYPSDAYARSKLEAEEKLQRLAQSSGFELVIVRPCLIYGPGVKGNFLQLLKLIQRGWPLPLASIRNSRSYLALDNLVDFIELCITHPAAGNQVYLLSDGEDVSTPELIRRMARALQRPARLFACPPRLLEFVASLLGQGEKFVRLSQSLQVDIAKARQSLDWSPRLGLDQGLEQLAKNFFAT